MSNSTNKTFNPYDCTDCYQYKQCPDLSFCLEFCPNFLCYPGLPYTYPPPPPPPPPPPFPHRNSANLKVIPILFAVVMVVGCLVCCVKSYRRSSLPDETRDEDHGPIVDRPVGYNTTVGLQPSIVHSIAVFKYKKGEGLVEGTDCSVCLNEFKEDECLRLMPNCSHAFHIPCIDTWLTSNTTCPMCRAPIVLNDGNKRPSTTWSEINNEDLRGN